MDSYIPGISFSLQSSEDYEQTSTLQYVNSQLVAHGFARSQGLSLDGISASDGERVVKCLMSMLSQRVEDMTRTEELGSKLRTLTYEHERLQSMHRTAVNEAANAEREMNLYKSKLNTVLRSLVTETSAHKQTTAELQRTRTSIQYLRSTTQQELKRKDKEVERILERWNRVSDAQVKLGGITSGLHCANHAAAAGSADLRRSKSIMEEALEQAEEARSELVKENEGFRSVILGTANALQTLTHSIKTIGADMHVEDPPALSHTAVFAPPTSFLAHPENAHIKLRDLLSSLREATSNLQPREMQEPHVKPSISEEEVTKLKAQIESLRTQLEQSKKATAKAGTEAQKVLDRFTKHVARGPLSSEAAEMSMELIGQPEYDALRDALNKRSKELGEERAKFTQAMIRLGKDKAELEAERERFLDEKQRWSVDQMLAEIPPTPGPDPDLVASPKSSSKAVKKQTSPRPKPQRKSSGPLGFGSPKKAGPTRRRVSLEKADQAAAKKKARRESGIFEAVAMEVLYEPELEDSHSPSTAAFADAESQILQRSTTPEDSPPHSVQEEEPPIPIKEKKSALPPPAPIAPPPAEPKSKPTTLPLILPTAFTLPPPSPQSSLSLKPLPLQSDSDSSDSSSPPSPSKPSSSSFDKIPLAPHTRIFSSPRTPNAAFLPPALKKHAYSPARPSPLSRILMIADSPNSPSIPAVTVPSIPEEEEDEEDESDDLEFVAAHVHPAAQGRGILQPLDEPSPLREKPIANENRKVVEKKGKDEEKKLTVKDFKGKGRAVPSGNMEKENVAVAGSRKFKLNAPAPTTRSSSSTTTSTSSGNPTAAASSKLRAAVAGKLGQKPSAAGAGPSSSTAGANVVVKPGGARRILVGTKGAGKPGTRML
ncbi:hypothetical protein M422DRAFT_262997 [Sphaerobolus stellatus SS14]|uniref:Uncharacterized protein n=1 Tax=Sphaerobolus stellatus (strain SS14) TaxID=990650 RepID=A0A0C9VBV3_SPHS4|nr:hypothetical protein M422DRAFT_262997 [Sphaerobolus stellatus SS14]